MSEKALNQFKQLVDKIDTAYGISVMEGDALLEDCEGEVSKLLARMSREEKRKGYKYLEIIGSNFKKEVMQMDDDSMDDEVIEEGGYDDNDPCCNFTLMDTKRRRELAKLAMGVAQGLDEQLSDKADRCYFLRILDLLAR